MKNRHPWKSWSAAGRTDRPYQTLTTPPSEMELDLEELMGLGQRIEAKYRALGPVSFQKHRVGYIKARTELDVKKQQFLTKWRPHDGR